MMVDDYKSHKLKGQRMKCRQGWYKIVNLHKFIPPSDGFMQSFNESEGTVLYKSSYELQAFRFADSNPAIVKFSVEPFNIKYLKPSTGKIHRYYIDMYLEFKNSQKFLVEIKPFSETQPPKPPKKSTQKALMTYNKACVTFSTNTAKWEAAKKFASEKGMKFIILTERELFDKSK